MVQYYGPQNHILSQDMHLLLVGYACRIPLTVGNRLLTIKSNFSPNMSFQTKLSESDKHCQGPKPLSEAYISPKEVSETSKIEVRNHEKWVWELIIGAKLPLGRRKLLSKTAWKKSYFSRFSSRFSFENWPPHVLYGKWPENIEKSSFKPRNVSFKAHIWTVDAPIIKKHSSEDRMLKGIFFHPFQANFRFSDFPSQNHWKIEKLNDKSRKISLRAHIWTGNVLSNALNNVEDRIEKL